MSGPLASLPSLARAKQLMRAPADAWITGAITGSQPFQIFLFIMSFSMVFRVQHAYGRYSEGRRALQAMTAHFSMAAVTACSFASGAPNRKLRKAFRMDLLDPNSWALAYANKFFVDVRHLMSLLHGVACMELREDDDLDNLIAFDAANPACSPPLCFTNLSAKDKTDIQQAQANRPNRINFRSFYGLERHQRYCAVLKLSIIGGMSARERDAFHAEKTDRTFLVMSWINQLVARRHQKEIFTAPPLTSRIFTELSAGYAAFLQAKALVDTPFPFPYAQMNDLLTLLFSLLIPFGVVSYVENSWTAFVAGFITSLSFFGLAEVNRELEDPFKTAPNDLPLAYLHSIFNHNLISLDTPWPHSLDKEDEARMYEEAMGEIDRILRSKGISDYEQPGHIPASSYPHMEKYVQNEGEVWGGQIDMMHAAAVRGGWAVPQSISASEGKHGVAAAWLSQPMQREAQRRRAGMDAAVGADEMDSRLGRVKPTDEVHHPSPLPPKSPSSAMLVSSQSPFVVYDAVVRSDYRQEHASPEERKAVLSARQVELEPVVPTPVSLGAACKCFCPCLSSEHPLSAQEQACTRFSLRHVCWLRNVPLCRTRRV